MLANPEQAANECAAISHPPDEARCPAAEYARVIHVQFVPGNWCLDHIVHYQALRATKQRLEPWPIGEAQSQVAANTRVAVVVRTRTRRCR